MILIKKHLGWWILAVVVALIILLPFKFPYNIYSTGKVFSVKEWVLGRNSDGRITSTIKDNHLGVISSYGGKEFQRGDIFDFSIDADLPGKKYIKKGEKIGVLYSNDLLRQLVELEGALKVEKALLQVYATGQKPETVKEAETNLMLAKERLDIKKKLLERQKNLFEDSLISPQEYDLVFNEYEMSRINFELAQARIQTLSTGEKPEQLKLSYEKILSLENQVKALKERKDALEITAPFSGLVLRKKGGTIDMEVLAKVVDTSSFIVITPIQLKELKYISMDQKITLKLFNSDCEMEGTVTQIDNAIQVINGKQAVYITAVIDKKCPDMLPGIFAQTVLDGGQLTILGYIKRFIEGLFYR
jgi:multidrug efflux pump subunit AcrA (membrane-fusion protein)